LYYFSLLLDQVSVFETNYITSLIINDIEYDNTIRESEFGIIHNYKNLSKTFFNKLWNRILDYGITIQPIIIDLLPLLEKMC